MNVLELCTNPHQEQVRYYAYLESPYDDGNDINTVLQITVEDDEIYGGFGDHTIRRKVEPQASKKCLDQNSATGFARGMSGFMSGIKTPAHAYACVFFALLRPIILYF